MRRFFALVFLFLYLYNIAGYLAVFSVMQYRIRSEVKKMLKATVPEGELITLPFHTQSLEEGTYPLQWIEDHEFRYNGSMYDILRSHASAETTYYVCINDIQEEQLFTHLDNHVQRQMADSGQPSKLDSFKDVFKDSFASQWVQVGTLICTCRVCDLLICEYIPVERDVPFLPPRLLITTS